MIRIFFSGFAILVSLAGCAYEDREYIIPAGHPADPTAAISSPISIPVGLNPVLEDVRPQITSQSTSKPAAPEAQNNPAGGTIDHSQHTNMGTQ